MITTSLYQIFSQRAYAEEHQISLLLSYLGKTQPDHERLPFSVILTACGLDFAIWCCRCEPQYAKEWQLYSLFCAQQIEHLIQHHRALCALHTAYGEVSKEKFCAAAQSAWSLSLLMCLCDDGAIPRETVMATKAVSHATNCDSHQSIARSVQRTSRSVLEAIWHAAQKTQKTNSDPWDALSTALQAHTAEFVRITTNTDNIARHDG